ncbi:MAG: molybdopterin-binding protein, partial [Vagococcus sp.]
MKAEIIAVGTEILLGQIVNTNATYLSEFLSHLGFDLYHQQVVGDNEGRLLASLEEASKRADLVVVCGGLGPTEDDLTKQTTAKFLGKELMYDKEAMERLEVFFQHSK